MWPAVHVETLPIEWYNGTVTLSDRNLDFKVTILLVCHCKYRVFQKKVTP